jgi:acyl-CoA reductase-like NAD-dependent aldehyde dehydrogenase
VTMDIDVVERAIKASVEEALKRMRQADADLTKAQQGGRGERNLRLAEALEEYNRCVAELTYYLKASGRHRDTDA